MLQAATSKRAPLGEDKQNRTSSSSSLPVAKSSGGTWPTREAIRQYAFPWLQRPAESGAANRQDNGAEGQGRCVEGGREGGKEEADETIDTFPSDG